MPTAPLGGWWFRGLDALHDSDRLNHGLVIVLPGIEGKSAINVGVAKGLHDAGLPHAIEIIDWTTGFSPLFAYHLRGASLHRGAALVVAERVRRYLEKHPDRPVYLIGHSGGAGVALAALENLPPSACLTAALLLAPAVSPHYDLRRALRKATAGVWNFYSPLDWFFLGACTLLLGTVDGRHVVAAGNRGFSLPPNASDDDRTLYADKLRQICFSRAMIKSWNFGGHNGPTNRLFAAEWLAPVIQSIENNAATRLAVGSMS